MEKIKLPPELLPYAQVLEKTKKPSLKIRGKNRKTMPLDSKFGGNPYWLKGDEYPTDGKGAPLRFLAQINFGEIKESIPDFPTEGILQFFVADDDLYGLNFEDYLKQDTFRVIYHETIETDSSKWMIEFPVFKGSDFPIGKECALTFEVSEEMVSVNDFRFSKLTGLNTVLDDENIMEKFFDLVSGQGSKIGGYPFFTQGDPRDIGDYSTYDTLLLQIDSDYELDIMWGDVGVANFFIAREDLKKRDFSKVLYYWDCY